MEVNLNLSHTVIADDDPDAVEAVKAIIEEEFALVVARIGDRMEGLGLTDLQIRADGDSDDDPRGEG